MAFVYTLEEMKELLGCVQLNKEVQRLYFVYPKKGNTLSIPHIGRDDIFPALEVNEDTGIAEGTNFRFNMMVSLDGNFTIVGMRREQLSPKAKSKRRSCRDFEEQIPVLEEMLGLEERTRFTALTQGYQRVWTTYILSAKGDSVRTKRLEQLIETLRLGYKTLEQLRKHKQTEE